MLNPKVQEKVDLMNILFCSRTDVYAKLWQQKEGSIGYSPEYLPDGSSKPLADTDILSHLLGIETIGVYPLRPDNTTKFLAIDFDERTWFEDALSVQRAGTLLNIPSYLERSRSGKGAHLWFFFVTALPAWKARKLGFCLLREARIDSKSSYDRMFPSQDAHSGKGLGNLIALPLNGTSVKAGNTCFIDDELRPYDQWDFLRKIRLIHENQVDSVVGSFKENVQSEPSDEEYIYDSGAQMVATISECIQFPKNSLPPAFYKWLKSKVNFSNPQFYEMERRGYSTWNTPRMIINLGTSAEFISVPRGFLEEITEFVKKQKLEFSFVDARNTSAKVPFKSSLKLFPHQKRTFHDLMQKDQAILEAKPGFGKTMVALQCVKERRQKTLIVVHTNALLKQWVERIQNSFELKKDDLGTIGAQKWKIGNKITVASYQTLARQGTDNLKKIFGFVIVDECHHVPAKTFTDVVKNLDAKYLLGLTATPYRKDQLSRLMTLYLGPIVLSQVKNSQSQDFSPIAPYVPTTIHLRRTEFKVTGKVASNFQLISEVLIQDDLRNELILFDLIEAVRLNGKCLVLTERVEHSEILLSLLRKKVKGLHAGVLAGKYSTLEKKKLYKRIGQNRFKVLIATGKLIGEGFDWPEMTHLFLVFPFSWKGKLVQYIGRVQRAYPDKKMAFVYDYVDLQVPMLKAMYFKRLRTYRSLHLVEMKKERKMDVNIDQPTLF
ncbi:MAG: hypothetical protein ACD_15C00189G0001 [uncultured bacterium]|nr:MAG: hypothetical protein ACD_15C00189G0001 [uncultured bacterium]